MISVRRARPSDAAAIGAVHVAAWRSTYAGILPEDYLAGLSVRRLAAHYQNAIQSSTIQSSTGQGGASVHVAVASGADLSPGGSDPGAGQPRVVGFATGSRAHRPHAFGEGEIETLYLLDDWRDRGLGRRLMRASASWLAAAGCGSAYLWVLRDNPSRWFYARMGGKAVAEQAIRFAGIDLVQTAYVWDPIDKLVQATTSAP